MGDRSTVEWLQALEEYKPASWNPIVGCHAEHPSTECARCYAELQAVRCRGYGHELYQEVVHQVGNPPRWRWNGQAGIAKEEVWTQPIRWTAPRMIFVCSMGEITLGGPEAVRRVFEIAAATPRHLYMVLTKDPEALEEVLRDLWYRCPACKGELDNWERPGGDCSDCRGGRVAWAARPLPNVWIGTTVGHPRSAHRLEVLARIPAAIRYVSAEPLVRPIAGVLEEWIHPEVEGRARAHQRRTGHRVWVRDGLYGCAECDWQASFHDAEPLVDWLLVGGESGSDSKVRPMHPAWVEDLVELAGVARVPLFLKQWGSWGPSLVEGAHLVEAAYIDRAGRRVSAGGMDGSVKLFRYRSKKTAGALYRGAPLQQAPPPPSQQLLQVPPGVCRACGCTDDGACDGGCCWAEDGRCCRCAFPNGPDESVEDPCSCGLL
jgi:protein gp37